MKRTLWRERAYFLDEGSSAFAFLHAMILTFSQEMTSPLERDGITRRVSRGITAV